MRRIYCFCPEVIIQRMAGVAHSSPVNEQKPDKHIWSVHTWHGHRRISCSILLISYLPWNLLLSSENWRSVFPEPFVLAQDCAQVASRMISGKAPESLLALLLFCRIKSHGSEVLNLLWLLGVQGFVQSDGEEALCCRILERTSFKMNVWCLRQVEMVVKTEKKYCYLRKRILTMAQYSDKLLYMFSTLYISQN